MDRSTIVQRPMGPRAPIRPSSPSRPIHQPSRSNNPALYKLEIPNKKQTSKGLRLDVGIGTAPSYYHCGPTDQAPEYASPEDAKTLKPPIHIETVVPQLTIPASGPVDEIRGIINELEKVQLSAPLNEDDNADRSPSPPQGNWSDDVFEELQRLGEGAGGAVHKVRDKITGRIMARKTITTRTAPRQLMREVSIMTSTRHVNIIRFYGAYMSPSTSEVKILMEYGEGGSLEAVAKRLRELGAVIGEKIAGRLAEGILQGLAYLHSKRTIHRDIKPSNILLTKEGIVRLCDFGVSGELVDSLANTFTGTSFYMAPERISGHEYTIRSDVWSTGITLLELVQNRFPFPNDLPVIELMVYITRNEPPRLEDEPGVNWSNEMKDFIKRALTVDPQARPTPKDMLVHPWIIAMMKEEANMTRWISEVYGWSKEGSGKNPNSRPSSSRTGSSMSNRSS